MSELKYMLLMIVCILSVFGSLVFYSVYMVRDSQKDNIQLAILASEIHRLDISEKILKYENKRQDTAISILCTLLGNAQNVKISVKNECVECHGGE